MTKAQTSRAKSARKQYDLACMPIQELIDRSVKGARAYAYLAIAVDGTEGERVFVGCGGIGGNYAFAAFTHCMYMMLYDQIPKNVIFGFGDIDRNKFMGELEGRLLCYSFAFATGCDDRLSVTYKGANILNLMRIDLIDEFERKFPDVGHDFNVRTTSAPQNDAGCRHTFWPHRDGGSWCPKCQARFESDLMIPDPEG